MITDPDSAMLSFAEVANRRLDESMRFQIHNFLSGIAGRFTVTELFDAMANVFSWSNANNLKRIFLDFVANKGSWPVEATKKKAVIDSSANLGPFINSMQNTFSAFISNTLTDADWKNFVRSMFTTVSNSQYTPLVQVHGRSMQSFIFFAFFKFAGSRDDPVPFLKLTHIVVYLCCMVEHLQLSYACGRSANFDAFRGAVPVGQIRFGNDGAVFNVISGGVFTANGACGFFTVIVLYMYLRKHFPGLAAQCDLDFELPQNWVDDCSDTRFCFSRPQCIDVLKAMLASPASHYDNPSSFSDRSFIDQLRYFIDRLLIDTWVGADDAALWSAFDEQWMLDVTDISMFLARCISKKVYMWRLSSADDDTSEAIEYPNGIDVEDSITEVCPLIVLVQWHSGHIVPGVQV